MGLWIQSIWCVLLNKYNTDNLCNNGGFFLPYKCSQRFLSEIFQVSKHNLWTKQPTWCQLVVEYMSTQISPSNQFLGKCVYTSTLPCRDHMLRFTYLLPHLNKNPMIKLFQSTSHHWGPTKGCRTVLAGLWRTLGDWVICRWTKIQLSSWHLWMV